DANSEEVTQILLTAAQRCSLVLDNPPPEIFLVDLQQGIQIFEPRRINEPLCPVRSPSELSPVVTICARLPTTIVFLARDASRMA
ncbi:hypothetical protein MJO10_33080, partial [Salmonella enterica subsp. enterica serovar Anatum]|nr:hypothetical protein [Salmonella enterica subsp. enterica serovar Anatum]